VTSKNGFSRQSKHGAWKPAENNIKKHQNEDGGRTEFRKRYVTGWKYRSEGEESERVATGSNVSIAASIAIIQDDYYCQGHPRRDRAANEEKKVDIQITSHRRKTKD